MKRVVFIVAGLLLLSSSSAFATPITQYDGNGNVSVNNADSYSTVIVVKGDVPADEIENIDSSDIVYIDQAETSFDAAVNYFLLTPEVSMSQSGIYTIMMGNEAGGIFAGNLQINPDDVKLDLLATEDNLNGTHNTAFITKNAVPLSIYSSIKVKIVNGAAVGGFKIDYGTIMGEVMLGVQLNEISDEYTNNLELYLSADKLSDVKVDETDLNALKGGN